MRALARATIRHTKATSPKHTEIESHQQTQVRTVHNHELGVVLIRANRSSAESPQSRAAVSLFPREYKRQATPRARNRPRETRRLIRKQQLLFRHNNALSFCKTYQSNRLPFTHRTNRLSQYAAKEGHLHCDEEVGGCRAGSRQLPRYVHLRLAISALIARSSSLALQLADAPQT